MKSVSGHLPIYGARGHSSWPGRSRILRTQAILSCTFIYVSSRRAFPKAWSCVCALTSELPSGSYFNFHIYNNRVTILIYFFQFSTNLIVGHSCSLTLAVSVCRH